VRQGIAKSAAKMSAEPPKNPDAGDAAQPATAAHVPEGATQAPSGPSSAEISPYPEINGFRLIQELARSPKGVIFKARRLVEQDVVAVKLFHRTSISDPTFVQHLVDNAENSFLLEHPGIVRSLGCNHSDGRLILIMEYAKGEPLSRALQRNVRFLPPRALNMALQAARALAYADQKRRYHVRLHPGDLIINDDEVRIVGVGLGERPEHPAWNVKDPHLFEPLIYAASESFPSKAHSPTDAARRAADLYSLGAILYHMLTGSPPFRATDEESLLKEREALLPGIVRWPRGTERNLPSRAVMLTERLLHPQITQRGDYESLIPALEEAMREAEGRPLPPAKPVAPPPPPPLAPAEIPKRAANPNESGTPKAAFPAVQDNPVVPVSGQWGGPLPRAYEERRNERLNTALLLCATVVVFACAIVLAAKMAFQAFSGKTENTAQQPAPAVSTPQTAPAAPNQPANPAVAPVPSGREEAVERSLAAIRKMLQTGEAKYSRSTLKVLEEKLQGLDPNSEVFLKVKLLIKEVEEKIAEGGEDPNKRTPPAQPAGTDAEDAVFQKIVARARELAAQQKFGRAIKELGDLPASLKLAPYPQRAQDEIASLEKDARAAYATLSMEANKAEGENDFAKARNLYQTAMVFEIPALSEEADKRIKALSAAEERANQTRVDQAAKKKREKELSDFALVARDASQQAVDFNWDAGKAALENLAKTATDPEVKTLIAEQTKYLQDEKWFFARCRQRLKETIERSPQHASPLQVHNAKDKDKPGMDITDFDEKGLTFTVTQGPGKGSTIREWKTIPPAQPLEMAKLLMDQAVAQEQLALALLSFERFLKASFDLKKNDPNANVDAIKAFIQDMKQRYDAALTAALQADGGLRDKINQQRATMERLAELILTPPAPPAQ